MEMNLVLHSERLTLRPFGESDVDIALELFTNREVLRYAGPRKEPEVIREEMPIWVRRGGNGCIGVWCITDSGSGEKLGTVALLPMPVEEDDTDWNLVVAGQMPAADVEVGYFLKRPAWGRGFATEACKRILQFAFEDSPLNEVVASFDEDNDASRNVLLKSGFVDRGRRRCYGEDGPDFRITREEWLTLRRTP